MRALVLSNMLPDERHPERGRFVRDQVAALARLGDVSVELFEFPPGASALAKAAIELRRRYGREPFDVVHAHFGLTAWPALAVRARGRALTLHGTDVSHPRTRLATRAVLPSVGLLAAASESLVARIPGRRARERAVVLPCGVDMERFRPMSRAQARATLEIEDSQPVLLFPADPARPEKRHDLARALADATGARLLTLGGVDPSRVPVYVNAANALVVPSEREGFGLAVLATPVGVHQTALNGLAGCLCERFELERWSAAVAAHFARDDPRVEGRGRAEAFSAERMAQQVLDAWRSLVRSGG